MVSQCYRSGWTNLGCGVGDDEQGCASVGIEQSQSLGNTNTSPIALRRAPEEGLTGTMHLQFPSQTLRSMVNTYHQIPTPFVHSILGVGFGASAPADTSINVIFSPAPNSMNIAPILEQGVGRVQT